MDSKLSTSGIIAVITLKDDKKVLRTLFSLRCMDMCPNYVFVADGSTSDELFFRIKKLFPFINIKKIFGNVAVSRYKTLEYLMGLTGWGIIVFIDSDQYATKYWLKQLTSPIINGDVDYTVGCEQPVSVDGYSRVEQYINHRRRTISKGDQRFFSMGGTAWKRDVFEKVGNFDPSIGWGGEDYDINIRATKMGFKGRYVKDAVLLHDYPEKTLGRWICKRLKYHTGTTLVYLKHKTDIIGCRKTLGLGCHPLDWLDRVLKVIGFIRGCLIYGS